MPRGHGRRHRVTPITATRESVGSLARSTRPLPFELTHEPGHAGLRHPAERRQVAESLRTLVLEDAQRPPLRRRGLVACFERRDAGQRMRGDDDLFDVLSTGHEESIPQVYTAGMQLLPSGG